MICVYFLFHISLFRRLYTKMNFLDRVLMCEAITTVFIFIIFYSFSYCQLQYCQLVPFSYCQLTFCLLIVIRETNIFRHIYTSRHNVIPMITLNSFLWGLSQTYSWGFHKDIRKQRYLKKKNVLFKFFFPRQYFIAQ